MKPPPVIRPMTVLDLFSGIGGFSLGLEQTGGFSTVAQVVEMIGGAILEAETAAAGRVTLPAAKREADTI